MTDKTEPEQQAVPIRNPKRVVSLVPSITESLFDLGLADRLVGITDYCIYPQEGVSRLPRVGGPKDARLEEIVLLKPDLVIMNKDENSRVLADALDRAGIARWVTETHTVDQAMSMLYQMAAFATDSQALTRVQLMDQSLDWVKVASMDYPPLRYFCPVWQEKQEGAEMVWMTFNQDTYSNSLLALFGGVNIFGDLAGRYPRVTAAQIRAALPEMIFLPDEPYPFSEEDKQLISECFTVTPAVQAGCVYRVDGSLITWYGTRLAKALATLPGVFEQIH